MMDAKRGPSGTFETLPDFVAWCSRAPARTHLQASEVAEILTNCASERPKEPEEGSRLPMGQPATWTWRERLWTVPVETRLGVVEVAEALGRPKSYVYARTASTAEDRLPHRKLDGTLVFTAGELRTWIRNNEEEIVGLPMESTAAERRLQLEGAA